MLLLDTHAFVWLASDLDRLPNLTRENIRQAAGSLYVSTATPWEIAILVKRSRLILPVEAAAFVERALTQHGIREISIDRAIALAAVALPDIHTDPFDRVIVATAQHHQLGIVTADRTIRTYPGVRTVWT